MRKIKRTVAILVLLLFPCQLWALSLAEEKKYGRQTFVEITKSAALVSDPYVSIYLDIIKTRLESAANTPLPVTLSLIGSDTLDAFATVGGYVFVTTGLLEQCEKEDEIAGVLAHEFGHVGRRHVAQNLEKQKFINWGMLATMLLAMLVPSDGKSAVMATGMGAGQAMAIKYTRELEEEADRVGIVTAEKAGYSGLGAASFLKRLRAVGVEKSLPQYLLTHPYSDDRIAKAEQLVTSRVSKVDGSLFPYVVARVKILGSPLNDQIENTWMKRHEKDPADPVSAYGAALVCTIKGKTSEAERILRQISSPYKNLFLGEFFIADNRAKEALDVLADQDEPIARYYTARAYEMQGELKSAAAVYGRLLPHAGTFHDIFQREGMVFGRLKEEGKGYENLGRYYLAIGRDKQAKMNLEKAVSKYGINSAEAKDILDLLDTLEPKAPGGKKKVGTADS